MKEISMISGVVIEGGDPLEGFRAAYSIGLLTCQLYAPSSDWSTDAGDAKIKPEEEMQDISRLPLLYEFFRGAYYSSLEVTEKPWASLIDKPAISRSRKLSLLLALLPTSGSNWCNRNIYFAPQKGECKYEEL